MFPTQPGLKPSHRIDSRRTALTERDYRARCVRCGHQDPWRVVARDAQRDADLHVCAGAA